MAKWLIDFYFGNTNYRRDYYLQRLEDSTGWVSMSHFQEFRTYKSYQVKTEDVFDQVKDSAIVDTRELKNGPFIDYQVRKRKL